MVRECRGSQSVSLTPVASQLTMGGCCSKCGVYTTSNSPRNKHTGDTPKLSRLQHKDSFAGGKSQQSGGSVGQNGVVERRETDSHPATPSPANTCQR